ncbi:MAG TPA: methyltransferase domain-containing protein [Thermoanaerobaculia bacterium]|nr:methyltransferase domain-containing protein [Thermoanaerobaculia bacterium]
MAQNLKQQSDFHSYVSPHFLLYTAELPTATVILLLDVLHYLAPADQEALLSRAAAALAPGGILLMRDADAGGGWRFTATRLQERFSSLLRGHLRPRFHYRSAAQWQEMLSRLGLAVDVQPMGMGTPYANVLLAGRRLKTET